MDPCDIVEAHKNAVKFTNREQLQHLENYVDPGLKFMEECQSREFVRIETSWPGFNVYYCTPVKKSTKCNEIAVTSSEACPCADGHEQREENTNFKEHTDSQNGAEKISVQMEQLQTPNCNEMPETSADSCLQADGYEQRKENTIFKEHTDSENGSERICARMEKGQKAKCNEIPVTSSDACPCSDGQERRKENSVLKEHTESRYGPERICARMKEHQTSKCNEISKTSTDACASADDHEQRKENGQEKICARMEKCQIPKCNEAPDISSDSCPWTDWRERRNENIIFKEHTKSQYWPEDLRAQMEKYQTTKCNERPVTCSNSCPWADRDERGEANIIFKDHTESQYMPQYLCARRKNRKTTRCNDTPLVCSAACPRGAACDREKECTDYRQRSKKRFAGKRSRSGANRKGHIIEAGENRVAFNYYLDDLQVKNPLFSRGELMDVALYQYNSLDKRAKACYIDFVLDKLAHP